MDISGGLNQPVGFYQKNTGNNINYAMNGDNLLYTTNAFMQEMQVQNNVKSPQLQAKNRRKNKNKRLNTVDTDYLPYNSGLTLDIPNMEDSENFFIKNNERFIFNNFNKILKYVTSSIPLINYFYLRNKEKRIKTAVSRLSNINQNVDEIINTTAPYGEESELYNDLADNLTKAANIIGETNKKDR